MNPINYPCAYCGAEPGRPCLSVGGRPIVEPHMKRWKAMGITFGEWREARDLYAATVCEQVLGTSDRRVLELAKKHRSLDEAAPWVKRLRVAQRAQATLAVRASDRKEWGVARMDEGIFAVARTRRQAVIESGIATRYRRSTSKTFAGGRLYEYTSEEGYQCWIGRVSDLLDAAFPLAVPLEG